MSYARIPTWLLVALAQYPRLTHGESRTMWALVHELHAYGRSYPGLQISSPTAAKLTGMSQSGARRCLKCLSLQPTEHLVYGEVVRRGHNMLTPRPLRPPRAIIYELNRDWRTWGWPADADLDGIAEAISWASRDVDRSPAARWGSRLLAHVEAVGIMTDQLPIEHPRSDAWQQWCGHLADLVERGYTAQDLEVVLNYLNTDAEWRTKVSGPGAARMLVYWWEGLLLRARRTAS